MADSIDIRTLFPCQVLPEDAGQARLLGLYPQRQDGLWMQRTKIPGGRLSGAQWQALADIIAEFTPETPLHLTTRQDLEIHNLPADRVPGVQAKLAAADMTTVGACGDTPRNVTVCPCGSDDLLALAKSIGAALADLDGVWSLPRKLKISLACSDKCGQPWINDIGMVASQQDGQWGFTVMAGGSLGAKPGTGMKLYDWLAADQVVPLAVAVFRMFAAEGDRENRRKARVRHVRERVGNEVFAEMIAKQLAAVSESSWPGVEIDEVTSPMSARAVLTFANGDITAEQASALAVIESADGMSVRIGNQHQVIVLAGDQASLDMAMAVPALVQPGRPQVAVVACPGARWCSRGITDTNAMAGLVRSELGSQLSPGATVCISGCPNGCSHAGVADFGLFGGKADGEEVYNLLAGGGMGRDDRLATMVQPKLTACEVVAQMAQLLDESE